MIIWTHKYFNREFMDKMKKYTKMISNFLSYPVLFLILLNSSAFGQSSENYYTVAKDKENPVVQWTAAGDVMNFKYDFLQNVQTTTLYKASPEMGTFSHHNYIAYFKGVLYTTWDNHIKDENGSGQRGLMRRSYDDGKTWKEVEEIFPPLDKPMPASEAYIGRHYQTANGFVVADDVLYALSDVADWAGPSIRERQRISIGRLCRSINPDGTLGELFWLQKDVPKPVKGFTAYPAGKPDLVKKINDYIKMPGNEIQLDFTTKHPLSDDGHGLTEPTPAWQIHSGTWVRLYRDQGIIDAATQQESEETKSRRNYATFSFDNGNTWTTPTRTNFPDACARANMGRLPDGQIYVINNVLPLATKQGGRALLAISLSRDGLTFDRVGVIRFLPPDKRYEGRAKAVGYQYPNSVVVGDNLWLMYSVNKEDIQVTRIPLAELKSYKM
jgi:hypothetical protein